MGELHSKDPSAPSWEHFTHVADIGIRGFGASMAEAFEQAALAMSAVVTDLSKVQPRDAVEIVCEAPNADFLLTDWLNTIVYEMATRKMLFSRFEVTLNGNRLSARAYGEQVDIPKHQPAAEVKGATLSELAVTQQPDGLWRAQCIVDV